MTKGEELTQEINQAADKGYLQKCQDQFYLRALALIASQLEDLDNSVLALTEALKR